MKVSIITVTYNSEKYLRQCIESVISQKYPDIEYIVIDGQSNDRTIDILETQGNHISILVSEPDNGIYDAMNKGIKLATGDIIGILNSDDIYADDNVLKDVIRCFDKDENLDIVYSDLVYVKRDDIGKIIRKWVSKPFSKNFFEHGNVPPHPTLFLKKRVYEQAGIFNTDFTLAADYEFMLRIFKKHNFKSKYLNRLTILMRLGGATSKNFKNIWLQNIEILNAWKRNSLSPPFLLMVFRLIKKIQQFS